jgi:2-(1,2-epoxy-1,2-dihydrophenyl)acetyl-CoA isomerase
MAVLELSRHGATAVLAMNRPAQRNALDDALRDALAEAIAQVRVDAGVRSVVLTGAGGHFCAGGDIKALQATMGMEELGFRARERMQQLQRWFDELVDLEKPVIAAVDGVAFGAGLSLALAADFVLASPRARFCAAFARIGLVPDAGAMYLLPRQVGLARAKELAFSAREVDAAEALRIGLAHGVVEGDLLTAALAFAAQFNESATQSIGIAKAVMNRAFESDRGTVYQQEAMAQAICRQSSFHARALRAFAGR